MFQKIALWGFIFSAALLTASMPASAQNLKEPELYFYPAKGWVVRTKPLVNAPTNGRQCYLTAEFNNGFYLQFSGTGKEIDRVSFDFRQSVFTANETYNAMLVVPGQMQESTKAQAVNGNVVTIDLNRIPGFLTKMRSASVLDLHLEENRFRFYLSALSSALGSYESCAAESSPASVPPTPVAEASQPKVKQETALRQIVDEQAQSAALDAGNPVPLEIRIDEAESAEADTNFPKKIKGRRLSTLLASQMDSTSVEGQDVAETALPPVADVKTEIAVAEPVIEVKEVSVVEAEPVAPVVETKPSKHTNYKTAWPEQKYTSGQIEVDITTAGENNEKPQSGKVARYSKTVQDTSEDEAVTAALRRKIEQLENAVARLATEKQADEPAPMREEENLEPPVDAAGVNISSDNWDLERATMRYNEAERQIKRLGRELAKERAKAAADKEELEAMLFDPQVTSQKQIARLADLEEQLSEAQIKLAEQRLRFEERIRLLESRLGSSPAQ